MRLLSWNLHLGSGSRAWVPLASALAADVVFLQEVARPDTGPWSSIWRPVPECTWGSAVGVRQGVVEERAIRGYDGWVIGGEWRGAQPASTRTLLYCVHAPTSRKSAPRASYVTEVRLIVESIAAEARDGATVVIGGDFNFRSFGQRADVESLQTKSPECAALSRFKELGLIPLWAALHPGRPLPQTLRWAKNKVVPYHCDGFLVSESLATHAVCEVLEAPALRSTSDHSPVAAWLLGGKP